MNNRRQLRLFVGFTVAILLVFSVGLVTYFTLQKQVSEQQLIRHTYKVIGQAGYIEQLMIDMETGRRGFRCTNDKQFLEPYYRSQPKVEGAVNALQELISDNSAQAARVEQLRSATSSADSLWKSVRIDAVFDDQDMKIQITLAEKQRMDKVRADIAAIVAEENRLLVLREAESSETLKRTILILVIGDVLILVIVVTLIRLILTESRIRNKAEEQLNEKVAELGRINEETNKRNWQLAGAREINGSLMGYDTLKQLAENCLEKVVAYIGAPAGAFYFYDDDRKLLKLLGGHALPVGTKAGLKLGEGITGQAATKKGVTIVKDIPVGYWQIESVSGGALPDTIIVVPLWQGSELKGVIEVSAFGSVAENVSMLLEQVSVNIATAVQAADASDKQVILLDKVQEQKEELESQQEELRQTNEELTQQAEVLRASEEELKTQEEELRQINSELENKTEAVAAASKELELKASELEISSKYKSEFLANMSHELRTPLNSVLILANLLKENKNNNLTSKQVEYAGIIHKSGNDLLTLINDILDLSKIEAGKVDIFFEPVRIAEVANDMDQLFSVTAADKKITYTVQVDPGLPLTIDTDKQRLSQVIKNLLSNAFKFTPGNGEVALSFVPHGSKVAISIKDSGIGIPADKQKLIFEAFQQADGSTSRKYGGTGLGLSISKELIGRLHGEVRIVSEPGQGSEFTVLLPLEARVTDKKAADDTKVSYSLASVKHQTEIHDDRNKVKVGEQCLLIIEDDLVFAALVNNFAHDRGFKTIVATRGDEGVLYAQQYKPAAIILDIGLPVIDGRSILKILKSDDDLKKIPIHVVTAEDRSNLPNADIESYFRKPMHQKDLEQAFYYIESYVWANYKNILLLSSGGGTQKHMFDTLTAEKNSGVLYDTPESAEDAIELLRQKQHDCIIVDIDRDIDRGLETLRSLKSAAEKDVYVITCLDRDISFADEKLLKQYSDSIIRKSTSAPARLMDEVELFLHKLGQPGKQLVPANYETTADKSLKNKKVLLVDDDMRNIFSLSALLEEQGMSIVTAENGKEALELLDTNTDIDIVLMDIMMPEMDGYEAIRHIRQHARYYKVPVIALTAKAMMGDREKCIEAGASDYISKPVDNNKLFSLMRVWLS